MVALGHWFYLPGPSAFGQSAHTPSGHWLEGLSPLLRISGEESEVQGREEVKTGWDSALYHTLRVPVQVGLHAPGDLRSASMPPMCGPNTFLVRASPLLPPRPAPPRLGPGPVETRRTYEVLLLSPSESAHHTTGVTQRRQSPNLPPTHPWRGGLHPKARFLTAPHFCTSPAPEAEEAGDWRDRGREEGEKDQEGAGHRARTSLLGLSPLQPQPESLAWRLREIWGAPLFTFVQLAPLSNEHL